jgi:hypothetical protein
MSDLDDVVRVVIFDTSTAITTASFQYPLVLSTFTNFAERVRSYNSIAQVGEDFPSTSKPYIMARQLFGQTSVLGAPPPAVLIGRRQVDSVDGSVATVTNSAAYTVTIAGPSSVTPTVFTYTSDTSATAIEIATGLKAAYDVAPVTGVTFTDNLDGTFDVAAVTSGANWSVVASTNLTLANTVTETWVEALEQVELDNDTWYLLTADVQTVAEQEALSDAIQAREKIYGLSSADVVAPTTGVTDIGYKLNAKSAGRTFGVYLPTAATEFPEAAWGGSQLAVTPGANDWDFKRASGVTVSKLSPTQIANLREKSWNFYRAKGGLNIFQDGNMFDKKPIDVQIGKDWLKARLQEAIYFRIINSLKIPMTDTGLIIVENEIRGVLSQAQANGLIDQGWRVTTPTVASIPETLRAQRAAGVFVIRARLQGAVRFVDIEFYLSV